MTDTAKSTDQLLKKSNTLMEKQSEIKRSLISKTTVELQDLKMHQERLLLKKRFIASLPDKGLKIKKFVEAVDSILLQRSSLTQSKEERETTMQSDISVINHVGEGKHKMRETSNSSGSVSHDQEDVHCLHKGNKENFKLDAKPHQENLTKELSLQMAKMELDSNPEDNSDNIGVNKITTQAYQKALLINVEKKQKIFFTNRSLKCQSIKELPEKYLFRSKETNSIQKACPSFPAHEESAASPPLYKYDHCKNISLTDSLKLQEVQRLKVEELQAKHAAEKLAARINITMENYDPGERDMSYRENCEELDSDDSDI